MDMHSITEVEGDPLLGQTSATNSLLMTMIGWFLKAITLIIDVRLA